MFLTVVSAIVGALIGAAITWRLGKPARTLASKVAETQARISHLEEEYARWEFVRHLAPRTFLEGEPPETQFVVLESDEEFSISFVEYLTGSGKYVARQDLHATGKRLSHAVEDQYVRSVLRLESNPWDGSGSIQFRFRTQLGDLEKDIIFVASVVPEIKLGAGGRVREYRCLVDPRSVATPSVLVH